MARRQHIDSPKSRPTTQGMRFEVKGAFRLNLESHHRHRWVASLSRINCSGCWGCSAMEEEWRKPLCGVQFRARGWSAGGPLTFPANAGSSTRPEPKSDGMWFSPFFTETESVTAIRPEINIWIALDCNPHSEIRSQAGRLRPLVPFVGAEVAGRGNGPGREWSTKSTDFRTVDSAEIRRTRNAPTLGDGYRSSILG